ncbi:MAG: Acg family FMN-binding oxidoreductase [Paludibacteraceae bacterium]
MDFSTTLANKQNPDYLKILEYAVKAPSGHNTQPWKFEVYESCIDVCPDLDKELPIVDKNHRELYISIGCAVENICIAAGELGYQHKTSILEQDSLFFIRIELKKSMPVSNPLFLQIDKRQTNRSVYQSKIISTDTLAMLQEIEKDRQVSFCLYKNGNETFSTLADFVYKGNELQYRNLQFKNELLHWIRFNSKQVEKNKDGLAYNVLGIPSLPDWMANPVVRTFLNPKAQNKSERKKIESSSHLVLFTVKDNTPEHWILAGRRLEQFLLKCTELGVSVAFLNQPCEVSSLAKSIGEKLYNGRGFPVLLLRIGYATPMPYSIRKALDDVIIR